jgi:FkbM family methyltransferase
LNESFIINDLEYLMNKKQFFKIVFPVFGVTCCIFILLNFILLKINWFIPILIICLAIIFLFIFQLYFAIGYNLEKIEHELKLSKTINGETDRWNIDEKIGEKKYYSQCRQDKWIIEDIFDYKENGFFVDLGAADGIDISNTYMLEKKYKWKGICIEAEDSMFKKLKSNRSCICVNVCIDDYEKKQIKFTKGRGLIGGIIDQDTDNKGFISSSEFDQMETFTLASFLDKYNAPKVIDYLSLDVEGAEHRIFRDFPFGQYKFLAMSIEKPKKELLDILKKNGYIKIGSNDFDKLFIHEDFNKYIKN